MTIHRFYYKPTHNHLTFNFIAFVQIKEFIKETKNLPFTIHLTKSRFNFKVYLLYVNPRLKK